MERIVEVDNLASLLVIDRHYEIGADAFRFQPMTTLVISEENYAEFYRQLPNKELLMSDYDETIVSIAKRSLGIDSKSDNAKFYKNYYKDCCYAIFKELAYCSEYEQVATNIIAKTKDFHTDSFKFPQKKGFVKNNYKEKFAIIRENLNQRGFEVYPISESTNEKMFIEGLFYYLKAQSYLRDI